MLLRRCHRCCCGQTSPSSPARSRADPHLAQGLGNVGSPLVGFLLEKGVARIVGCDTDPARVAAAQLAFAGKPVEFRLVVPGDAAGSGDVMGEEVDILSPCAYGGVLNERTVPRIRAKIVCGAANSQLADPRDDSLLASRGVLYVPDFVANRMGIVNCANEQYGSVGNGNRDPMIARHLAKDWPHSLFNTVLRVLQRSEEQGVTPAVAANALADELCELNHPIFPNRARDIIGGLVEDEWASSAAGTPVW